jgi:hypothetical protein
VIVVRRLSLQWKQKVKRACVGAVMACLGPIAIAHNGGPDHPEPVAHAQADGQPPVAMWRCGRSVPPRSHGG